MRIALMLLVALAASPALAEDGRVSQSTLKSLGLESMQAVSDQDGSEIRGASSGVMAGGVSLMFAVLVDGANPGNFLVGTDLNGGMASAENAGLQVLSQATQGPQGSSIVGRLELQSGNPLTAQFLGSFAGNAGNASNIGNAGFSSAFAQ